MDGLSLLVGFLVGGAAGAAVAWLFAAARTRGLADHLRVEDAGRIATAEAHAASESARRADLERDLAAVRAKAAELDRLLAATAERQAATERALAEQRGFLDKARTDLEAVFKAAAADALRGNQQQFLNLASERLDATQKPLKDTLDKLEKKTGDIESARVAAYSRIDEQVKAIASAAESVQRGTTTLATALKSNQVRGRWGEVGLRNVVEFAGMVEHCDFTEQATTVDGSRPDMTVRLPGGRCIAVDAKAPMDAYLRAVDASVPEAERERALGEHAAALRAHVRALSRRDYAKALGAGVDFVVLFLPAEPLLSAAFARAPDLQAEAFRLGVLVTTPVTLVALLRNVALYHQQEAIARNAQQIAECARELYERGAKFAEHLSGVGKGLGTALRAYNAAVGSFDDRFLKMGSRLEELKAVEQANRGLQAEAPEVVNEVPRTLRAGAPETDPAP